MRIGIDCRKAADYGIGRYIRGLVGGLAEIDSADEYTLFAPESLWHLLPSSPRFHKVEESSRHYTIGEPFTVGRAAAAHRLELFHATHYVVPLTPVPVVVTIHDLIHLKTPVWRRHPLAPLYARWMLARAARAARRIITLTGAVSREVIGRFPVAAGKTAVTPPGIDAQFVPGEPSPGVLRKYGVEGHRYLLFVGNDKPHKNLERLVEAFGGLGESGVELLLVGGSRRFHGRGVIHAGFVPEEDLPHLYRGALCLVQPSLEEGFGFPVVEAMRCGTPALIADQPALMEVAGGAALVADRTSVESIGSALRRMISDASLRSDLRGRGIDRARHFSWKSCAEKTLEIYRHAARG